MASEEKKESAAQNEKTPSFSAETEGEHMFRYNRRVNTSAQGGYKMIYLQYIIKMMMYIRFR